MFNRFCYGITFVLRNGKTNQIFNVDGIGNIFIMGRRSVDEGTNFQGIGV